MNKTLSLYFLRKYAIIAMNYFIGLFILIFIIDFAEFTNRFSGLEDFRFATALQTSLARVPMILQQAIPFVALAAAMTTLYVLNRKYELVVARAAGLSAWQFLTPLCIGALLFGLLAVLLLNPLAARGFELASEIEADWRGNTGRNAGLSVPWIHQKVDGETIVMGAKTVLRGGSVLRNVSILRINERGDVYERVDAFQATLREGEWEIINAVVRRGSQLPKNVVKLTIPTNLDKEFVSESIVSPETVPFFELPRKIEAAQSYGLPDGPFSMHYHSLIALPALLVAMTLIAATVSLRFVRFGQSISMILGGILSGFLLYVVTVLVKSFGGAGFVPPVIAAWLPVMVALFVGTTFLLYREDG